MPPSFDIKDNHSSFESVEELINSLIRGGEIEFIFNNKKYSITYPKGKLCFTQIGDDFSEVIFEKPEELLNYEVDCKKIYDIVTSIEDYRNKIRNNPNRYYINKWFESE